MAFMWSRLLVSVLHQQRQGGRISCVESEEGKGMEYEDMAGWKWEKIKFVDDERRMSPKHVSEQQG